MADDLLGGVFGPQSDPLASVFGNAPDTDFTAGLKKPAPAPLVDAVSGGPPPARIDPLAEIFAAPRLVPSKKAKAPQEPDNETLGQYAREKVTSAAAALPGGIGSSLKGLGNWLQRVQEVVRQPDDGSSLVDPNLAPTPGGVLSETGAAASGVSNAIESAVPEGHRDQFGNQLAAAAGGIAGLLATGAAGGARAVIPQLIGQGFDQVNEAMKANGESGHSKVGLTAETAGGAAVAILNTVGLGVLIHDLPLPIQSAVLRGVTSMVMRGGADAATFMAQGIVTKLSGQLGAGKPADWGKTIEGAGENAAIGGIIGGAFGAVAPHPPTDSVLMGEPQGDTTAEAIRALSPSRDDVQQVADLKAGARLVTPEDQSSPLPTDLIAQGKGAIANDLDLGRQNDILRANETPDVGKNVTLDRGALGQQTGQVLGSYSVGDQHGVRLGLDDGSTYEQLFNDMKQGGHSINELIDKYLPQAETPPNAPEDAADASGLSVQAQAPIASEGAGNEATAAHLPSNVLHGLVARGIPAHIAEGIAAGTVAEDNANPDAVNQKSGALGIGQWLGSRKDALVAKYGDHPTLDQQLDFLTYELKGGDPGGKSVLSASNSADALDAYITKFMRPAAGKETEGDLQRGLAALGAKPGESVAAEPSDKSAPVAAESEAPSDTTAEGSAAPKPSAGDLWNVPPDELQSLADRKRMSDHDQLVEAFGSEERAKRFESLDRQQNSMDPRRADEGARLFDQEFGNLTPEQQRLAYGTGETDAQVDDLKELLKAHSDVIPGDDASWSAYMAAHAARKISASDLAAVPEGRGSIAAQAAYVRIAKAYQNLRAEGVAANEIPKHMAQALVERGGWEPHQAAEVIGSVVKDLMGLNGGADTTAEPTRQLQIAAPSTTEAVPSPEIAGADANFSAQNIPENIPAPSKQGTIASSFDEDPVKAIAALPQDQFEKLGATLGVRPKFVKMRLATRFLDNAKIADVRDAYVAVAGEAAPSKQAALKTKMTENRYVLFDKSLGSLDIPRSEMPQIKSEDRSAMAQFMRARGIDYGEEEVPTDSLKPTQTEYSPAKVEKAIGFTGGDRAILVSADNQIVDGTHQWVAALRNGDPTVRVIRLQAPIRDVLAAAHEFPSSTTAKIKPNIEAKAAKGPAPAPRPRDFFSAVAEHLDSERKKTGVRVRIGAEDAISHGVPADEIYINPKAKYPTVKLRMAKVFSSTKAPLMSKAAPARIVSLDYLGNRLDAEQFGAQSGDGVQEHRMASETAGDLLARSLARDDSALDRHDHRYDRYTAEMAEAGHQPGEEYHRDRIDEVAAEHGLTLNDQDIEEAMRHVAAGEPHNFAVERAVREQAARSLAELADASGDEHYRQPIGDIYAGTEAEQRGEGAPQGGAGPESAKGGASEGGRGGEQPVETPQPDRQADHPEQAQPAEQAGVSPLASRETDTTDHLQRKANERLIPSQEQKPVGSDGGLFDSTHAQTGDLFTKKLEPTDPVEKAKAILQRGLDALNGKEPAAKPEPEKTPEQRGLEPLFSSDNPQEQVGWHDPKTGDVIRDDSLAEPTGEPYIPPDEEGTAGEPVRGNPDALPVRRGGTVRALGIADDLRREGATTLTGREISHPQELAQLAQVYRDPRHETFRVFFIKNGETVEGSRQPDTIIHATGVSARLTSEAPLLPGGGVSEFKSWLRGEMERTGADGYYLLHNHPSGEPKPSLADENITTNVAHDVPGFIAHVVINSGRYAVINEYGKSTVRDLPGVGPDKLFVPSKPHQLLGTQVTDWQALAKVAKDLQQPGHITVAGTDSKGRLRVIVDHPESDLERKPLILMAALRRIKRASGSDNMFLVGSKLDHPSVREAYARGLITDAVDASNGHSFLSTRMGYTYERLPLPKGFGKERARFVAEDREPYRPEDIREGRFGDEVRKQFGVEPSALTSEESGYLAGFRNADGLRARIAKARDERGRRLSAEGISPEIGGVAEDREGYEPPVTIADAKPERMFKPVRTAMEALSEGSSDRVGEAVDNLRTIIQDRMLPVLRTQAKVELMLGRKIADDENPYLAEELFHGRTGARLDDLTRNFVEPLFAQMREAKIKPAELEAYLYARHAPERNERISQINPKFRSDILGEGPAGSGMSNGDAKAIMDAAAGSGHLPVLVSLAAKVDGMLKQALDTRVESGLLSEDEANLWRKTYQNYVPLRGLPGDEETEGARINRQSGMSVKGKESRMAFGRKTPAQDILAHSILQAEEAIVRSEQNEVAKSLGNLAQAAPDPHFWTVDKIRRVPVFNKSTGQVSYRSESRIAADDAPYTVSYKDNGIEHRVTFNRRDDTAVRTAAAMRNLNIQQYKFVVSTFGALNRLQSAMITRFAPNFIVTNAFRDLQTAGINLAGTDLKGLEHKVLRDYPAALVAATKGEFGKGSGEWAKWYRDFKMQGGHVAFNDLSDISTLRKKVDRAVGQAQRSRLGVRHMLGATLDVIDNMNGGVENALRLATYKNAVELGATEKQAASLAKNVTVNFNRKGTAGPLINSLYLFFNASVQGNVRIMQAMKSPKVRRILMASVVLGFLLDQMNRKLSDKDKDGDLFYNKIPEYDKDHNFIFMYPGAGQHPIKIPMPWGYNSFPNLGRMFSRMVEGDKPTTAISDFLWGIVDAFNPLGGAESLLRTISPSAGDSFIDLYTNTDYAGRPIMPDARDPGQQIPNAQRYFSSIPPYDKWITDKLAELTGGDSVRPGSIDISPEVLDYLQSAVLGGVGTFGKQLAAIGSKAVANDPTDKIETSDIPFASRVIANKPAWYDRSAFYARLAEVEQQVTYAKEYAKEGNRGEVSKLLANEGDILSLDGAAQAARKQMRADSKINGALENAVARGEITSAEAEKVKKQIADREDQTVNSFNSMYLATAKQPLRP